MGDVLLGAAVLCAVVAAALSVVAMRRATNARDEARSAAAQSRRVAAYAGVPRYWREPKVTEVSSPDSPTVALRVRPAAVPVVPPHERAGAPRDGVVGVPQGLGESGAAMALHALTGDAFPTGPDRPLWLVLAEGGDQLELCVVDGMERYRLRPLGHEPDDGWGVPQRDRIARWQAATRPSDGGPP